MIAIDTNILLRYLLQDDEKQFYKAAKLILGAEAVLITDIVIVEAIWTLKGKRYNLNKEQIIDVIHALFAEPNVVFEDSQAVWGALKDFINATPIKSSGKTKQSDFPDALIVNKAKRYGEVNKNEVSSVFTFDKAALEIAGTKHP
jgi:predicted nucleic-acid-binding protein